MTMSEITAWYHTCDVCGVGHPYGPSSRPTCELCAPVGDPAPEYIYDACVVCGGAFALGIASRDPLCEGCDTPPEYSYQACIDCGAAFPLGIASRDAQCDACDRAPDPLDHHRATASADTT